MPLLPDRSREISVELARPIIEYVEQTLRNETGGLLAQEDFEAHAAEFFLTSREEMHNFSKEIHEALQVFLSAYIPLIMTCPDAAITVLAGHIQVIVINHKLNERVYASD